ncbi:hypothetical protein XENOCAPTIV_027053 [Xenoophorus captivus]|uniref:Uncharacterized protein n=1 Tax=Xenoophorus captivus TaxID=1517983 RepID=A0ABV0QP68_9TELE
MNHLGSRYSALYFHLLLCLLTGCASQYSVTTTVGADVSLMCTYAVSKYGRLPFCWARESTSLNGCNNQVIKSDGTQVLSSLSWRYSLMGNLGAGDASLTIRQVLESDSGKYICRVEIPGWFNDQKTENILDVYPGRPSQPNVEIRELKQRAVTVGWIPPFNGGRDITTYLVYFKRGGASWDTAVGTQVVLTQVTLVDLRPGMTYDLHMFAVNSVGMSDASNVLTFKTYEAAPEGPPLDMQLQALSSQSIRVTWKPPDSELRNGVLRSYNVNYRDYYSWVQTWQYLIVAATGDLESIILTNLKPSTRYEVFIQARTDAGPGPASNAHLCSTLKEETTAATKTTSSAATTRVRHTSLSPVPPDPPVVVLKEVINNTISLFWTPGFEGNSPITGFYLEYKAANASWDYNKTVVYSIANKTQTTITEVNPSTYNIRMFAKNRFGASKASNVLTVTIEERGVASSSFSPGCVSLYAPRTGWDFMLICLVYLLWFFAQTVFSQF